MQRKPPADVLETDPGTGPARVVRLREHARVLDADMQYLSLGANINADLDAVLAPTMFDRILDQRLQQEARDAVLPGLRRHVDCGLEPIAEARLLYVEIGVEAADLET